MRETRDDLTSRVLAAGRAVSTAAVMYHAALSQRLGLSATEEKALELLQRFGPLTAGELARHSGLAPNTATYVLDRLQRKDFVRRKPHPEDGRKVIVEFNTDRLGDFVELYTDFVQRLERLCAEFSDDELVTIQRFMSEAARVQHAATERLTGEPESPA